MIDPTGTGTIALVLAGGKILADWASSRARNKAETDAAQLKLEGTRRAADAEDHTAEVTEREGYRKRVSALEAQLVRQSEVNLRLQDGIDQLRLDREKRQDEKHALQKAAEEDRLQLLAQISSLQLQLGQLSEQVTHASTKEAEMTAEIVSLRAEVVLLRTELARRTDQQPNTNQ